MKTYCNVTILNYPDFCRNIVSSNSVLTAIDMLNLQILNRDFMILVLSNAITH